MIAEFTDELVNLRVTKLDELPGNLLEELNLRFVYEDDMIRTFDDLVDFVDHRDCSMHLDMFDSAKDKVFKFGDWKLRFVHDEIADCDVFYVSLISDLKRLNNEYKPYPNSGKPR